MCCYIKHAARTDKRSRPPTAFPRTCVYNADLGCGGFGSMRVEGSGISSRRFGPRTSDSAAP